jgi:hypothetical protein
LENQEGKPDNVTASYFADEIDKRLSENSVRRAVELDDPFEKVKDCGDLGDNCDVLVIMEQALTETKFKYSLRVKAPRHLDWPGHRNNELDFFEWPNGWQKGRRKAVEYFLQVVMHHDQMHKGGPVH